MSKHDNLTLVPDDSEKETAIWKEIKYETQIAREAGKSWAARFNNFETNIMATLDGTLGNPKTKFEGNGKTGEELVQDIRLAIEEEGVDFQEALRIHSKTIIKNNEIEEILRYEKETGGTFDSDAIKKLGLEMKKLRLPERFLEIMLPVYVALRKKGYSHAELCGS